MPALTRRTFAASLLASLSSARAQNVVPAEGYSGWPTIARRANGDLVVAWSGNREAHVCPFGVVNFAVSRDQGQTWTWPRTLLDTDIDDRDAGILETPRGTLLVTTFTSLAYEPSLERARRERKWPPERLARWEAIHRRLDAPARRAQLGCWMLRSTDGGVTWSAPYRVPLNSPHGPIAASKNRLFYAGKDLWGDGRVGVCQSTDDGLTWTWLAGIPTRPGDQAANYHELHAVETAKGRLIVQIRNHNEANRNETLQCESEDGGKTWSVPHGIGVWGLPSHLLRLRDNRLLMTYGYRREPFGNQARVSADEGHRWSDPITISDDGASVDLGYPSTVELSDGDLLTLWYELPRGERNAVLRLKRWQLKR